MKTKFLPDLPPTLRVAIKPNEEPREAMNRVFDRFTRWEPIYEYPIQYSDNLGCYFTDIERFEGGLSLVMAFPGSTGQSPWGIIGGLRLDQATPPRRSRWA